MKHLLISSLLTLAAFGPALQGAAIVGFEMDNFDGIDSDSPSNSWDTAPYPLATTDVTGSFTDSGLETLTLTAGPEFEAGAMQQGFYRFAPVTGASAPTTSNDVSGMYIEFTLEPMPNYAFSLDATDSIAFYSRTYDTDDNSAGLFLRSSADNYASNLDVANPAADGAIRSFSVGSGFTGVTEAVTFRAYIYDTDGVIDSLAIRRNGTLGDSGELDFVINGTVTEVPEPASVALLAGLATLAGALLYRRRK